MKTAHIARIAHEINRGYCASLGDTSQPSWEEAPEWQQQSAIAGVEMHLANPDTTPEQAHESWLEQKEADGWTYGEAKDVAEKKHPCCLPYDELPPEQKAKDYIFAAVVRVLKDIPDAEEAVAAALEEIALKQDPEGVAPVVSLPRLTNCIAVKYIGPRDVWSDRVYHTGLSFTRNMVRSLPAHIARKFLRHADVFEEVELAEGSADDTGFQLDEGAKEKAKRDQQQRDFDVIDQVNSMTDKDSLVSFAESRYGLKLTKTMKVETMKDRIVEHVNRFGSA